MTRAMVFSVNNARQRARGITDQGSRITSLALRMIPDPRSLILSGITVLMAGATASAQAPTPPGGRGAPPAPLPLAG